MGTPDHFQKFANNLAVSNLDAVADRHKTITRRLNLKYWRSFSAIEHSVFIGSYGRGTATTLTVDVDVLFRLPGKLRARLDAHKGNGQYELLRGVVNGMRRISRYATLGSDGHTVHVPFNDGSRFDVLVAFADDEGGYTYPDAHDGGSWQRTNPAAEIVAIDQRDREYGYNLKRLCRMTRAWREMWGVPMSGLLIDTLAYEFIGTKEFRDESFEECDVMSREFFGFLAKQDKDQLYWVSPGADAPVWRYGDFEEAAAKCEELAVVGAWRRIYGELFPV